MLNFINYTDIRINHLTEALLAAIWLFITKDTERFGLKENFCQSISTVCTLFNPPLGTLSCLVNGQGKKGEKHAQSLGNDTRRSQRERQTLEPLS